MKTLMVPPFTPIFESCFKYVACPLYVAWGGQLPYVPETPRSPERFTRPTADRQGSGTEVRSANKVPPRLRLWQQADVDARATAALPPGPHSGKCLLLWHWEMMRGGIVAGQEVRKLTLNIGEQAARAKP
jgi:hypothetical protein